MTWRNKYWYTFGIGFWSGALVYSLVNFIMNLKHASNIMTYDAIITGVAVIGVVLNLIMYKLKDKEANQKQA